ncbi:PHP domain-containing protein [Solicola sp. PLA-1-18]|uniref:PHP domain-containing protein n=1 Tax=Solicola sp. PLA-1-18 TaxID=3380532 RepID=UPI003B78DDC1
MRIDLHTHSTRSDGTDTPAELVANAVAAGLDVVALTDHDATTGWDAATQAAEGAPLELVRGLEISCRHHGAGVHLLAYEPDAAHPGLHAELRRVLEGRNDRLPRTLAKLADLGYPVTAEQVAAVSGDAAATGRPHIADAMVGLGYVVDRDEAFGRFLMPGRPAYVDRYAADLETMIGLVRDAGGVTVVAHPWSRGSGRVLDADAFAHLRDAGLTGIEVDHNDHTPDKREALRGLAGDLDLVATGSSDYHGTGKVGFDLGCHTTDPEQLERLRDAWHESARVAARAGDVL